MLKSGAKIVKTVLSSHGFQEYRGQGIDYNIAWTQNRMHMYALRLMTEFQKINHFPNSAEITRKDRLFRNVQRMQHIKSFKQFDIVPTSFVLPTDMNEFIAAFLKDKGPYIIKPNALSRGRGIYLVSSPDQVPMDESVMACRYISNPCLV